MPIVPHIFDTATWWSCTATACKWLSAKTCAAPLMFMNNLCQLLKTLKTPKFLLWTFEQVFSASFLFMQLQVHSIQCSRLSLDIRRGRNTRVMWVEVKHSSMEDWKRETWHRESIGESRSSPTTEVYSHINTAFDISTQNNQSYVFVLRCIVCCCTENQWGWAEAPQQGRPRMIAKYFEHYTITKNHRNVFITRRGFRSTPCTCIYNTQHLFPELKHSNNMCSWSTHTNTHTHTSLSLGKGMCRVLGAQAAHFRIL